LPERLLAAAWAGDYHHDGMRSLEYLLLAWSLYAVRVAVRAAGVPNGKHLRAPLIARWRKLAAALVR
jgi:hypothetical protein